MDWQNEACTEIWKLYQKGVDYFNRQNLYSKQKRRTGFSWGISGTGWRAAASGCLL